jgi:hypothetical protein
MSSQLRNPETPAERNVRIATEQGAIHPEAVVAILKPYDEPTAGGAMPFAIVGGQSLPLASAVTRLRAEVPALAALFDANGQLDIAALTPDQYRSIRDTNSRELLGLGPKR